MYLLRPGWSLPVASFQKSSLEERDLEGVKYLRAKVDDLHLSQPSALLLLQGSTLKSILDGVLIEESDNAAGFYSLVTAEPPCLWKPPANIRSAVFARIVERPVDVHPEEIFRKLFIREFSR